MRHLDRSKANPPTCLSCYRHGLNSWNDLTAEDRMQIWEQLSKMQGELCAYCESRISEGSRHVEHFRDKHRHPALTFNWENLLGCCMSTDSCGHYKDSTADDYDATQLIDPSIDDPDRFFSFRTDGTITVRVDDLTDAQHSRAAETLRVLNLDDKRGRLRKCRKTAIDVYLSTYPDMLSELQACDEVSRRDFAEYEISCIANDPYSTPIRHLLKSCI